MSHLTPPRTNWPVSRNLFAPTVRQRGQRLLMVMDFSRYYTSLSSESTTVAFLRRSSIRALAGPMTQVDARSFYYEFKNKSNCTWLRLTSEWHYSNVELFFFHEVICNMPANSWLRDPDRGWELIGRSLSHLRGVPWEEFWPFLGILCASFSPNPNSIGLDH